MKHIILYENFGIEISEEKKLSSGALMTEPGASSTIIPGELYVSIPRDGSGVAEASITILKKDKSSKTQLHFTDEKDSVVTIKDGNKEVKGAKMYVTYTKSSGDEVGGTAGAWIKCDETTTAQAIDSFLANSGLYRDLETGKIIAPKMVLTILEIYRDTKDRAPAALTSMATVLSNAAKLNKNIIPTNSEEQKDLNKLMLSAAKKFLNPTAGNKE